MFSRAPPCSCLWRTSSGADGQPSCGCSHWQHCRLCRWQHWASLCCTCTGVVRSSIATLATTGACCTRACPTSFRLCCSLSGPAACQRGLWSLPAYSAPRWRTSALATLLCGASSFCELDLNTRRNGQAAMVTHRASRRKPASFTCPTTTLLGPRRKEKGHGSLAAEVSCRTHSRFCAMLSSCYHRYVCSGWPRAGLSAAWRFSHLGFHSDIH